MTWLLLPLVHAATPTDLVPLGADWAYLDDGSVLAEAWVEIDYDDSAWAVGPAPLGFGGWEATTIDGGPAKQRHITTWFRHSFSVANPADWTGLTLDLVRDDGAVVTLNGVEVVRDNLPVGSDAATYALADVTGLGEIDPTTFVVDPSLLVAGDNVLAVEVHQSSDLSDDLSFDLGLVGWQGAAEVTRGPYLQAATDRGLVVRWRTDAPIEGHVDTAAGPAATGPLALDHEVLVTGFAPQTTTTYTIGTPDTVLAGGAAPYRFTTAPAAGASAPVKLWVIGDSGTADAHAEAVASAFTGLGETPDLWLMLGDNAYNSGTDSEYQAAVFDLYTDWLPTVPLWPTIGNHDGYTADSSTQIGPYFDIFTLPTRGEAGGEPSGTEAYYSFDWGPLHVVCLDSYESDRTPGSAMLTWLADDLAATTSDWVLVFWHHPPYSKGSHDSDTESWMVDMRTHVVPILDAYGVDLVLTGHSHSYERSFLVDGHYGASTTLTQQMVRASGPGSASVPYTKPSPQQGPGEGAVYAVAGSSGQASGGSLDHPIMVSSLNELGSMVIDIDGPTLTGRFIDDLGTTRDTFVIEKGLTTILELWADPEPVVEGQSTALHTYAQDPAGQEVVRYEWDLDDGQPPLLGADQVVFWADDATVPITVTAEDASGVRVQRTLLLEVENLAPVFTELRATDTRQGVPATLRAAATDVTADTVTITWAFDDGSTAVGPEVQHVFLDAGPASVVVTAADEDGGEAVASLDLVIAETPATEQTIYVSPAEEGRPVVLSAGTSSSAPDDPAPVAWAWELYDGQPPLEGAEVSTTWPDDGAYPVTLTVTDSAGGVTATTVTVNVANVPPQDVQLSVAPGGVEGEALVFTATATDPGDDALSMTWSFGDGTPRVTAPTTTYAYGTEGTYPIELTVYDGDGGITGATSAVTIVNAPPTIVATSVPDPLFVDTPTALSVTATDPGTADELVASWSFGDGDEAEGVTVAHTWTTAGPVSLLVTVDDGTVTVSERVERTVVAAPSASTDPDPRPTADEPPAASTPTPSAGGIAEEGGGCGCRAASPAGVWLLLPALLGLSRRSRR